MASVIYSENYLKYNFGAEHPFSPQRLVMLLDLLQQLGALPIATLPPQATRNDVRTVHQEAYVKQLELASASGKANTAYGLGTSDTPVFLGMEDAARWVVGGTLHGAKLIASEQCDEALQLGGGLHHAAAGQASGFCVYNDLSVAIAYFRSLGWRVAYLDLDVHHGDGVQWIHYQDPEVLTLSIHQCGRHLYPGTGHIDELGKGKATGTKINIPLEPFTSDNSYLEVFQMVAEPALQWFQPDVIVVQCGADSHYLDPLAEISLSMTGFKALFNTVFHYVDHFAEGKALYTLGGGYSSDSTSRVWAMLYLLLQELPLPERLPQTWLQRWGKVVGHPLTPTLMDSREHIPRIAREQDIAQANRASAQRLLDSVKRFWV